MWKDKVLEKIPFHSILVPVFPLIGLVMAGYSFYQYYPSILAHVLITISFIFSMAPLAVFFYLDERKKNRIDAMLPRFLGDMYENQEAGLTLIRSLEAVASREYGPLTDELTQLIAQLTWGVDFETAFKSFQARINTELTTKTVTFLLEATRLGGDLKTSFSSISNFVTEMNQLREERETQLRPYMMIIYISTIVFMIIIIILYQSFFSTMQVAGSQESSFMKLPLSLEDYKGVLFDLVVVVSLFGGITAGKISEGRILSGLRHSLILMSLVTVTFGVFFIDPFPPIISNVEITPLQPVPTHHVTVTVEVKDAFPGSGIRSAHIVWTTDDWKTESITDMDYNLPKEHWEAQIQQLPVGTTVQFYIKAVDNSGNTAVDDNGKQFYSYVVTTIKR